MMNLITVVIPAYNASRYIEDAIKSVLNQNLKEFKLIIINDGSTDDTLSKITKYQYDKRVEIIDDGENIGLISRLNDSIQRCKSKYYVRMDADDIMFPDRLEKQLYIMENNLEAVLVHNNVLSIDADNNILGLRKQFDKNKLNIVHPTVFAKTNFLKENLYRSEFVLMEDLELWRRTYNPQKFIYDKTPILFYREDSGKISDKHKKMFLSIKIYSDTYFDSFTKSKILLMNRIKFFVYRLYEIFGLEKILISKRYCNFNNKEFYYTILNNAIANEKNI